MYKIKKLLFIIIQTQNGRKFFKTNKQTKKLKVLNFKNITQPFKKNLYLLQQLLQMRK